MSVEAMSLVLTQSKAKGTSKVVLIGIANHDGDGGSWPSIATLARYANVTPRAVQQSIAQLVDLGEVVVHANAGGTHSTPNDRRPNRYEITITAKVTALHGVKDSSPRPSDGVKPSTQRGEAQRTDGVKPTSPEPSLNHPEPAAAGGGTTNDLLDALHDGFLEHPLLDSISFSRVPTARGDAIASLVELHGVPRLVRAALATTGAGSKIRRVDAYLTTWADLRVRKLRTAPVEPMCPSCGQAVRICAAQNATLNPEDRCEGATA